MKRIALLSLASLFACVLSAPVAAATPAQADTALTVKQVLTLELAKDTSHVDRRELLHPTTHPKTASDAEWWQAGFVKSRADWNEIEKTPASESSALMDRYRAERDRAALTAADQLKLANWCRDAKLPIQERAHLCQALMHAESSIDRIAAYKRMGYLRVGNQWASPAEVQQLRTQALQRQAELRVWRPVIERIVRNGGGNGKQQKLAKEELEGIHVRSAIPALMFAAETSEPLALAICQCLEKIDCFESSQALAGLSVQSTWSSVRKRATEVLKNRRIDDFAPAVLAELHTSLVSSNSINGTSIPRLIFREDSDQHVVVDVGLVAATYQMTTFLAQQKTTIERVQPRNAVGFEPVLAKQDRERRIDDVSLKIQTQIDAENDRAEIYNERAAYVLAAVSGQERSSDPRFWWAWWNIHTATEPIPKRRQVMSKQFEVPVVLHRFRPSCLVAGTPVCTDRGFVAIEQLNVGDLVLSKDISTGELAYKPVLHTTVRNPVPIKKFAVGGATISASDGHHFWISGLGWTKTRELEKGQPVHTATAMARIESVEAEPDPAPVYNLVVADFHTYFVGPAMILSHDVLPPSPTNVKVPGLEVEVVSKSF